MDFFRTCVFLLFLVSAVAGDSKCTALGGQCRDNAAVVCRESQRRPGLCSGASTRQCCLPAGAATVTTKTATTPSSSSSSAGFSANPLYRRWCGGEKRYLDDRNCAKVFPSDRSRDFKCGTTWGSIPSGYTSSASLTHEGVDTTTLPRLLGAAVAGVDLAVILIKRSSSGVPHFRVLATPGGLRSSETWSSSKIYSVAAAASAIREQCPSVGGLTASVKGKPLGDLATIICSYDHDNGFSSNGLSKYFGQGLAGTGRLLSILRGFGGKTAMSGSYGQGMPSLGTTLTGPGGATCRVTPKFGVAAGNSLTPLTAATWLRNMVLLRELPAVARQPGLQWADVQTLLYGATHSKLFPQATVGGMSVDPSIYLQSGLDMNRVASASGGKWRILSKLGAGYSSSRRVGEILSNAYVCLGGQGGAEFVVSGRVSVPGDASLSKADVKMQAAMAALSGYLQRNAGNV
jgi:hypothetical protein